MRAIADKLVRALLPLLVVALLTCQITPPVGNLIYVARYEADCRNAPANRAWIDPPVRKEITGNTVIGLPTFQFTLTPVTEDAPMPAGTTGGVKTATIQGGGSVEFGVITYDTDGTYEYEVREVNTGQADWTYDTAVYTLTVVVSTDKETGECTATTTYARNGEPVSDMTAMVFTNNFTGELPPTPGPTPTPTPTPTPVTPKTGEPASIAGLLTAIGSAVAAVGVVMRRKND